MFVIVWCTFLIDNMDCEIASINLNLNHLSTLAQLAGAIRIHPLHLCRGVRHPPTMSVLDITLNTDGEAPVMLEVWGMQSYFCKTNSL